MLALVLLEGCRDRPPAPPTVSVEIVVASIEPYETADGGTREVSIANPHYDRLVDGSKIVLRAPTATLRIDYPLHHPTTVTVSPDLPDHGYSLRGLVRSIAEHYAAIYREEAQTTTKPITKAPGLENRAETDGKYGIWGHGLEDLVLERITIRRDGLTGGVVIDLSVGS